MTSRRTLMGRWLSTALVALALAAVPVSGAWGQSRPGPRTNHQASGPRNGPVSGKVAVRVMVVHAHNEDNKIAPELRGLERQLGFLKYSGFKVIEIHPSQLGPGGDNAFSVAGGRRMNVQLVSRDAKQAKMRLRMFKGNEKIVDTTVSIPRNKSFMIGGPNYKGGKLIFPVTVSY